MRIRHVSFVLSVCLQVGFCQRPGVSVHGIASDYMMYDSEVAKLPQRTIKVNDHGKSVRFQGVLLADILARVHTPNSNEAGSHYLAAEGANGDQAMFSWVELDPSFSHKAVYVITKRNGEVLSKDEGPFELMVPGEKNNARWVRQLRLLRVEPDTTAPYNSDQGRWIVAHLPELESIKIGMTRRELLTVFMEEGGLSWRAWNHYAYRKCPFVKVSVEFTPVGDVAVGEVSLDDRIKSISRPYLELIIAD
jgi:Oxidoreductase molybdopterin binding domain